MKLTILTILRGVRYTHVTMSPSPPVLERFSPCKTETLYSLNSNPPPLPTAPSTRHSLLSVSVNLPIGGLADKWPRVAFVLYRSAYFPPRDVLGVHPGRRVRQDVRPCEG